LQRDELAHDLALVDRLALFRSKIIAE